MFSDIKTNPNISPCSVFLSHSHKFCGYGLLLPFFFHKMKIIACLLNSMSLRFTLKPPQTHKAFLRLLTKVQVDGVNPLSLTQLVFKFLANAVTETKSSYSFCARLQTRVESKAKQQLRGKGSVLWEQGMSLR